MERWFEFLAVVAASASILAVNLSVIQSNLALLRLLVKSKQRVDSLNSLMTLLEGRLNDVEQHLSINNNYQIRQSVASIVSNLRANFGSEDTGF